MQTPVQQIYTPDNYNYTKHEGDISVLQVEGTFPNETNCKAIELPPAGGYPRYGYELNVTGWGYPNLFDQYFTENLQIMTLQSAERAQCLKYFPDLASDNACAYETQRQCTSVGDHGDPVAYHLDKLKETPPKLYGVIITWNLVCTSPEDRYEVMTFVGNYTNWIQSVMSGTIITTTVPETIL